ncbi:MULTISPECIES: ABC transporter substrate-binding protein [unclassified Pseudactinotalea]|uniref:ABC transporter substrate-binding protein n=1 Tax=unclassified Pseudactinotalea TaxID=2649176 RepID=UPI00128AEACB|nr:MULTISPECIES: ABC transporter substrate-binding protein [unclassified Pseudactinotalea]MPV51104.1 ABC transporter substrate-binding protein [Pseudactinotalea sp. HY160]QGH70298.1 ABC transporter substrate-binding protein [Pseudactinotalea sp. HY158]
MTRMQIQLNRGAARGALAAAAVLALTAACSSTGSGDDGSPDGAAGDSVFAADGTLTIQLSYLKEVGYAGDYIAETDGYFEDEGFGKVDLIAGPTAVEAAVAAGNAEVGYTTPIGTASMVANQDTPIRIVGVLEQRNAFTIMSLPGAGAITEPADLIGTTIAVPEGTATIIVQALLKANGIAADEVQLVPGIGNVGMISGGEVDGYFTFETSELVAIENGDVVSMPFADHGLPVSGLAYAVTTEAIENDRDAVKAFLVAELRGWADAIDDPELAVQLTMDTYGSDLGLDRATQEARAQRFADYLLPGGEGSLLLLTDEQIAGNLESLGDAGIDVAADDVFDMTLLQEIYQEHPDLQQAK